MGISKLKLKLEDPDLKEFFEGIFPKDHPKNARFSINFFYSIGLNPLTHSLRQYLFDEAEKKEAEVLAIQDQSDKLSDDSVDADSIKEEMQVQTLEPENFQPEQKDIEEEEDYREPALREGPKEDAVNVSHEHHGRKSLDLLKKKSKHKKNKKKTKKISKKKKKLKIKKAKRKRSIEESPMISSGSSLSDD
jgi:pre-mRNA-splicing factor CWC22